MGGLGCRKRGFILGLGWFWDRVLSLRGPGRFKVVTSGFKWFIVVQKWFKV